MPYAVRLNPDPPAGRTGSDGLKFRMATSGIRAGALLCRSGTAWVSDRIQTRVYRRRPLSGLEEHDAKSQEHPNDKRSLVTHTLDDGRSSWAKGDAPRPRFENGCLGRARREDLDRQFPLGRGGGYDASMPAASPRPAPTRFGRQRSSPHTRPRIWRRFGRWKTQRTTRHRGTADDQLSRTRRPLYPRAQFRPPTPAGAWSLNSGDSPEIPTFP